jgi:CRP-like cAMP-binding protein
LAHFNDVHPLIRKLESVYVLADNERDALQNLPMQITDIRAGQDIVREGDRPSRSFVVLEGFACSFKMTSKGRRQIMAFYILGDIPDLQSLLLRTLDHSLGTITPCRVGFMQHETLRALCQQFPRIGEAFWRNTLIDASVFREWVANIGRRDAYNRIAHLICELVVRMRAVGLTEGDTVELPITQREIGDAMGLSNVHVNRVLTDLRKEGLIEIDRRRIRVPDWEKLKVVGDFDPTYLHLEREQAAA